MTGLLQRVQVWLGSETAGGVLLGAAGAAAVGVLVWFVLFVATQASFRVLKRLAGRTRTDLDDELLARMEFPARWLGPTVGVHAAAATFGAPWVVGAAEVIEGLLVTYAAVAAFEILIVETWLEKRQGIHVPPLVRQVVIGVVYGCVLLGVVSSVFNIDITPLLATTSVTTVVVGLALQQPLGNLFSGLVLHFERTPSVGDWILIDGREGLILQIGWRSTRLRLLSDDVLIVPNSALMNAQLINFSQPTAVCARLMPVPVPLDIPPHEFEGWVREVLGAIEGVPAEPAPKVWLTGIEDHCQRYTVKFWVVEFRRHDDIESEFLKGIWYRMSRAGVAFPVPHQALRFVGDKPPPAFAGLDPVRATERPPPVVPPRPPPPPKVVEPPPGEPV